MRLAVDCPHSALGSGCQVRSGSWSRSPHEASAGPRGHLPGQCNHRHISQEPGLPVASVWPHPESVLTWKGSGGHRNGARIRSKTCPWPETGTHLGPGAPVPLSGWELCPLTPLILECCSHLETLLPKRAHVVLRQPPTPSPRPALIRCRLGTCCVDLLPEVPA